MPYLTLRKDISQDKNISTTLFKAKSPQQGSYFSDSDDTDNSQLSGPVCGGAELSTQRNQPHHLQLTGGEN